MLGNKFVIVLLLNCLDVVIFIIYLILQLQITN